MIDKSIWWNVGLKSKSDFEKAMKRIYTWYENEIIDRAPIRILSKLIIYSFVIYIASVGSHTKLYGQNKVDPESVKASSEYLPKYKAEKAFDGIISDDSRWVSSSSEDSHWIIANFSSKIMIQAIDIYSGYHEGSAIESLVVQIPDGNNWIDVPNGRLNENNKAEVRMMFAFPFETNKIRIVIDGPGSDNRARLKECIIWEESDTPLPGVVTKNSIGLDTHHYNRQPTFDMTSNLIFLNQSGFNKDWPKRFTAPLTDDGIPFSITTIAHDQVLYSGVIKNHVGDFSDFVPADFELQYVVRIDGGDLKPGVSDPFFVSPYWMQRVTLEPMLRMFVDDRSVVGTMFDGLNVHPWRDSPFYAYSMPSLVHLFLSNPSYFNQQKVEIDWERDFARAFDDKNAFNQLDRRPAWGISTSKQGQNLAKRVRNEVNLANGAQVPDIVKLIQWGTAWWYIQPESEDHSFSEYKLHPETVANFAFFLYAYPYLSEYIDKSFEEKISKYAFSKWEEVGLLNVDKTIGTFKGRYAPGWSILPNLMMYEAAKSRKHKNAQRYLDAAAEQAKWIINDLDFKNPNVTKGQRMSEHKTMNGLIYLVRHYPEHAPEGWQTKLADWSDIIISRSDNLWDYRKYDDGENWSLPSKMEGHTGGGVSWNDPGNLAGLPSSIWKVSSVLDQNELNRERIKRMDEIAISQWDILFGRNPLGAHSAWRGPIDFLGVERGWPRQFHLQFCAGLETVRGVFNSSPATEHFPFNPEGEMRHAEGWTAFNAAFNVALAESVQKEIEFEYKDGRLIAKGPFFVPSMEVEVIDKGGHKSNLTLYSVNHRNDCFSANLQIDGEFLVRYGYGYFAKEKVLNVSVGNKN